jgi:restriction system protein
MESCDVANTDVTVWGIHGGRTGDADTLFLKKKRIALGWHDMPNLNSIAPNREAFKAKTTEVYHDAKLMTIAVNAGQLYRFVHEMQVDELVVYPSRQDQLVHIGKVTSAYEYKPDIESKYPHTRLIEWLKHLPRTKFSQAALYEIGSAMSFFQVKNYADEFITVTTGKNLPPPAEDDTTVGLVAEEIEQMTRDFILKQLARELKGHPFARFVAHLLETMGYRTRVSPEGPDGGIDIIAHKDELGFEPPIIKVQVKATEGTTGDPTVSSLYGKVGPNEYGLLVSLGTFTPQAKNFAQSKSNFRLVDGKELVTLVLQHYEQFDSQYKGLLPLKRVYIPEKIQEAQA